MTFRHSISALCTTLCAAALAAPAVAQGITPPPAAGSPLAGDAVADSPMTGNAAATPTPVRPRGSAIIKAPIRSLTRLHGSMHNTIGGVGLVTGLATTGAGDAATRQALANLIQRYNLRITPDQLTTGSVALVTVSAELPPFSHEGQTIDVSVRVVTDAISLEGGFLEECDLVYHDGAGSQVYATASGSISTGGFGAQGSTSSVVRNTPTKGRITRGATIVQSLEPDLLSEAGDLQLNLLNPSLRTAQNIAQGINRILGTGGLTASAHDEALIRIALPQRQRRRQDVLRALTLIRDIEVAVEHPRKVVVHQDTGTIIAGAGVQISPCVVAMSDLTISVVSEIDVVQPPAGIRNPGTTERVDRSVIDVTTSESQLKGLGGGGATVGELLENLKALQMSPRQLIEVFRNLDAGHFLHAPLEVR